MTAYRNLTKISELDDVEQNAPLNGETIVWDSTQQKFIYTDLATQVELNTDLTAASAVAIALAVAL